MSSKWICIAYIKLIALATIQIINKYQYRNPYIS